MIGCCLSGLFPLCVKYMIKCRLFTRNWHATRENCMESSLSDAFSSMWIFFSGVGQCRWNMWWNEVKIVLQALYLNHKYHIKLQTHWMTIFLQVLIFRGLLHLHSLIANCTAIFQLNSTHAVHKFLLLLTLQLPWVTKTEFLLTISIQYKPGKWWK